MTGCGSERPSTVDTAAESTTSTTSEDDPGLCNKQRRFEEPLSENETPGHPTDEAAIAEAQREAQGSEDGHYDYYARLQRSTISDSHAVWQTRDEHRVVAEVGVSKSDHGWRVTSEFYLLPPEVCRRAYEQRQERLRQPPDNPTTTSP